MNEPRLCEYLNHRSVGRSGWVAQYEAKVMQRSPGDYAYLSGWYSGMLDELLAELGGRELEHICDRLRRRQQELDEWYAPKQENEADAQLIASAPDLLAERDRLKERIYQSIKILRELAENVGGWSDQEVRDTVDGVIDGLESVVLPEAEHE